MVRELGLYLNETGSKSAAYISLNHDMPWSRARLGELQASFCGSVTAHTCTGYSGSRENAAEWVVEEFESLMRNTRKNSAHSPGFIRALGSIRGDVRKQASRDARDDLATPLFRQAMKSKAQIWVVCEAQTALRAHFFLGRMPEKMRPQLVCLDDAPELQLQGITGYNYNIGALCRQAVELCLRPGTAMKQELGFIVPRAQSSRTNMQQQEKQS